MTLAERLQRKADDYRAQAGAAAAAAADPSTLDAVRAGHVRSERRWLDLADVEETRLRIYHSELSASAGVDETETRAAS